MNEFITMEVPKHLYLQIPKEVREQCEIKVIEPKNIDYSFDEQWREKKKISDKAFKDRKKREYEINQQLKNG